MTRSLFTALLIAILSGPAQAQLAQVRVSATSGCQQGSCQRYLYYATGVAVGDTDAAIVFATASHSFETGAVQVVHVRLDATDAWIKATSYTPRSKGTDLDVALVYVPRASLPEVPLLPIVSDAAANDSTADLVSYDGSETQLRRKRVRITSRDSFRSQANIQQGNSGGPLVNADGDVVGLVWAHGERQTDGYMVEAAGIRSILSTMKVRSVIRRRESLDLLPPVPPQSPPPVLHCPAPGICPPGCRCTNDLAALQRQVTDLSTQLEALSQRPRDDPVDLGPLRDQLRNLEQTKIPVRVWRQDAAGQWQIVGSSDVPLGDPIHLRLTPQSASQ